MASVYTARTPITWLVAAIVAACHHPPTARERVLAALPGDAIAVAVADGRALAHPRLRGVLDAIAARWPASLGCVFDAAVASDAAGLTVDAAGNIALAVALPRPPRCAVLSQRAPGLWLATIGAGPAASAGAVRDAARFARARPYLEASPIAVAVLGGHHVLAAAEPDPLDAWVAIDVPGSADAVAAQLDRLAREPRFAALAAHVRIARPAPTQLVVRVTGAAADDLTAAARLVLAWADAAAHPEPAPPSAFACPPPARAIACSGGTRFEVASLALDLAPILTEGRPTPVVIGGSVTGLRLASAVRELGLEAGDVVVAMAGRVVNSRTALADWIARARGATTVTLRRGATETVLQFAERGE